MGDVVNLRKTLVYNKIDPDFIVRGSRTPDFLSCYRALVQAQLIMNLLEQGHVISTKPTDVDYRILTAQLTDADLICNLNISCQTTPPSAETDFKFACALQLIERTLKQNDAPPLQS